MILVVTPCGARKLDKPARAAELYTGSYFRASIKYARTLAPDDRIRILSARHGLIPLDRLVAPYELRFGQPGALDVPDLIGQAVEQKLTDADPVIVLGGREYSARGRAVWPNAITPLAGIAGGLGAHLHALSVWTTHREVPS